MTLILATLLTLCSTVGIRSDCVHDGDSIVVGRERIRIENIDAPELDGKCPQEAALALKARDRLTVLLRPGFALQRTGTDRYGRTLARITANGRDIGQQLIREQLARPYRGKREPWC